VLDQLPIIAQEKLIELKNKILQESSYTEDNNIIYANGVFDLYNEAVFHMKQSEPKKEGAGANAK
jgi:hypothetical protein